MNVANRVVGQRLVVGGGSTGRVYLGPFSPGERVDFIVIDLSGPAAVAGDVFALEIKAFGSKIADVSADFAVNGRPLTGGGIAASQPRVALGSGPSWIPVNWVADDFERWLGVEVTSAVIALDGCVFFMGS